LACVENGAAVPSAAGIRTRFGRIAAYRDVSAIRVVTTFAARAIAPRAAHHGGIE
jgi:hypothetical protein